MGTVMEDVRIRQGRPSDGCTLVRILASERMATDIDPVDFIVAEIKGKLLGAAKLTWVGTDEAFLRPIVVAAGARGSGLGRALLERLFGLCSSISVIARSDAVPFYGHLGFKAVDWSSVPGVYREECEFCDDLAQCRPVSMRWASTAEQM
jgi:N-acetylglutamate synthase-like GNAT family acetyltransferase